MHSRLILRSFVLAAAFVLSLPVLASAQTSRVEGMALQGDYIKDYTAIYTYPSCLPQVGNLVYGELGNQNFSDFPATSDRAVGVVMDKLFGAGWGTWGIHLHEDTPNLGSGDAFGGPGTGSGGSDPNFHTNESFDIMWGKKSGTTSIGLRVNRSFVRFEDKVAGLTTNLETDLPVIAGILGGGGPDTAGANLARNIFGVAGGIAFQMNPNTSAEFSILFQNRTYELSQSPGDKYSDDGPTTYMVAARAMWQWQPNVMVVPVFKWYSFDLSQKSNVGGVTNAYDNSLKGWQLGAAADWTLGTNDMMVWGVTFAQNKLDQQNDVFGVGGGFPAVATVTETLFPQVFGALETHVNNWLTLRFGANKGAFEKIKIEDKTPGASETITTTFSSFNMNIGAGVKLGTLQLDAVLANNFPQTLGWLGSGSTTVNFPKVTATYNF